MYGSEEGFFMAPLRVSYCTVVQKGVLFSLDGNWLSEFE